MQQRDTQERCHSFQIKRSLNQGNHNNEKFYDNPGLQQKYLEPDDCYFAQGIQSEKRNKLTQQQLEKVKLLEQEKETVSKSKKQTKIDLNFLKCYWKKDYLQLAKTIQNEKESFYKELPILVSSYTKDSLHQENVLAQFTNRSFQAKKLLLSDIITIKDPKVQDMKYDFHFGDPNYGQSPTSRRNESRQEKQDRILLLNSFALTSRDDDENKTLVKQGRIFKGTNLKQQIIKRNVYKNLETLMEHSNRFYLKYQTQSKQTGIYQNIEKQSSQLTNSCGQTQSLKPVSRHKDTIKKEIKVINKLSMNSRLPNSYRQMVINNGPQEPPLNLLIQSRNSLQFEKAKKQYDRQSQIQMLIIKKELEFDSNLYLQEQVDQMILDSKRRAFVEFQLKIKKTMKKSINKKQFTDKFIDDVSLKVQGLINDFYEKNKSIFRKIHKVRNQMKQRVDIHFQQNQPNFEGNHFIVQEIEKSEKPCGIITQKNSRHQI